MQSGIAKPVFFHLLILSAIIGTIWLGVWQLHRREWKHDVLARLDTSYRNAPKPLLSLGFTHDLAYSRKMIDGTCNPESIFIRPGRYHDEKAGGDVFCVIQNKIRENLLVQLGWVPEKSSFSSKIYFRGSALLVPFTPPPWWLPKSANPHEIMWPVQPAVPAYSIYAILDAQGSQVLSNISIIPTGEKPELPDDHLEYAITWFTLAGVLLALYIYRVWSNQKPSIKTPSKDSF